MKRLFQMFYLVVFLILLTPGMITLLFSAMRGHTSGLEQSMQDIETYVIGVVAAEMPALFHEEALKAQAVAARTYAVRHESEADTIGQAYISEEEMQKRWGSNFSEYYDKISRAVMQTKGEIIIYDEEPIEAVFHALSAGVTENSGEVWLEQLPYLQSVDSSFDETSPGFLADKSFTVKEAADLINKAFPEAAITVEDFPDKFKVESYTQAGYVKDVIAGKAILEAGAIRRLFSLRSTNFNITYDSGVVVFTTKGYGHGAGLSQYGSNYLAQTGYEYRDILKYYYKGVTIGKQK